VKKLERIWKEAVVACSRYYTGICIEKTTNASVQCYWIVLEELRVNQLIMEWNPEVPYCVRKSPPLESILGQTDPVHIIAAC
jgi:hypothetical protein